MKTEIRSTIKILSAAATIAIAAQWTIDISAIPITGQTLAILSWAFFLSPKESILALLIYLTLGFLGAPIFADGASGIEKLYGGSGGFLVGFLFAAGFVSTYHKQNQSNKFLTILNITFIGTLIILLFGIARLSILYGFNKGIEYGLIPFWKGALIKIILGSIIVFLTKKIVSKDFGN